MIRLQGTPDWSIGFDPLRRGHVTEPIETAERLLATQAATRSARER
jgi:hypothetical protein